MAVTSTHVLEVLKNWVNTQPSNKVWNYINDNLEITETYTYLELERASSFLASQLLDKYKLKAGDRALLVFFPSLSFSVSLLACFKAGVIAVPVFPPDPRKLQKDLDHFVSIQKSSEAKFVLTHSSYDYARKLTELSNLFSLKRKETWPSLQWIVVDDILSQGKSGKSSSQSPSLPQSFSDSSVAFLQYTSGSTSEPKGVVITHGNLAHNLTLIIKELKADRSTINVSWLPQYHDMGLIGSYLGALYCGGIGYYISPISFLKNPNIWLQAISKFNGTHTQAPNFAYALAVRKFKEYSRDSTVVAHNTTNPLSLNLAKVKHMINAAEPVDVDAIHQFYEVFRPFGLADGVVVPTYGLAEHTVFVCSDGRTVLTLDKAALESGTVSIATEELLCDRSKGKDEPSADAAREWKHRYQRIVGCGFYHKADHLTLKIVNPETCVALDDGLVGEIWVSSPSKAAGYWNQPELSADAFQVMLKAPSSDGLAYLRTGDLGFLHNGELFICGRQKDMIIVRGANHYPQDIERTAEMCVGAIRAGCSAAFAIPHAKGHTETIVYVAEVRLLTI